nr:hypothetical protein CFP56_33883 [Quercus suber]
MGPNIPSSCGCSREWGIKGKSESLLGGGVIGENRSMIIMGIVSVVKEKKRVEILRRGETEGMGRECEKWSEGAKTEFWWVEYWDGEEVLVRCLCVKSRNEEIRFRREVAVAVAAVVVVFNFNKALLNLQPKKRGIIPFLCAAKENKL